jgi:hypothetical protein
MAQQKAQQDLTHQSRLACRFVPFASDGPVSLRNEAADNHSGIREQLGHIRARRMGLLGYSPPLIDLGNQK